MKLIASEMPKSTKECPFHTKHDPNSTLGYTIDIDIDPPTFYCELTRQYCDLHETMGTYVCSGLQSRKWH